MSIATEAQTAAARALGAALAEQVEAHVRGFAPRIEGAELAFNVGYALLDCVLLARPDLAPVIEGVACALGSFAAQQREDQAEALTKLVNVGFQKGLDFAARSLAAKGRA